MTENKEHSKRSWFKGLFKSSAVPPESHENQTQVEVTDDFWVSIGSAVPFDNRLAKLHQFEIMQKHKEIDKGTIQRLWVQTKDFLNVNVPLPTRTAYFEYLRRLIDSQYRQVKLLRPMFYEELELLVYTHRDDVLNVMLIINALSDHGKNLCLLEQEIGSLLIQWMDVLGSNTTYLSLLLNIIKFNSSYLGRKTIEGIVNHLCEHGNVKTSAEELQSLLEVLDVIMCYNNLPQACMHSVTVTLCHTLNVKGSCDRSWKLMRNLLGTNLGHSCLEIMCSILQDGNYDGDISQSAVSFIGMGLWGTKCVNSLTYKPQTVLLHFESALKNANPAVGFEIALTCQRLVKKFGHELHTSAWDSILSIILRLLNIVDMSQKTEQYISLQQKTHELLTLVEKLHQTQAFNGSVDRLFNIVEMFVKSRPPDSVVLLITYRAQAIKPIKECWTTNLLHFVNKFYHKDMNVKVILKILDILAGIIINNLDVYEKDLLDTLVIPKFQDIHLESRLVVQENVIKFILQICKYSTTNRCLTLLKIFHPFVELCSKSKDHSVLYVEGSISHIIKGLTELFIAKLNNEYAAHAIEAYKLMVVFLNDYYLNFDTTNDSLIMCECRSDVFETFFKIRANEQLQILLASSDVVLDNVVCKNPESIPNTETSKLCTFPETYFPFTDAFGCIILCLSTETFWPLLENTLHNLCDLLLNKSLILTVGHKEIDSLASALTNLVTNSNRYSTLLHIPSEFKRSNLQSCAVSTITVLSSFHEYIGLTRQRQLLRCLESGFNTKNAKQCIAAITLCMMEMKSDALLRILPSILLHLSQMSATVHLAAVVLELLSSLSQLPNLYKNFVEDQYMSVFAIALQHTNPHKFSPYIVSLAHHVVSMWFAKCRLSFRPEFVRYIIKNLQNVNRANPNNSLQHLLIESCLDVLSRYTFSNSMPVTKGSLLQRSLSKTGQTASWLLGNRLITIKTDEDFDDNASSSSNTVVETVQDPFERKHSLSSTSKQLSFEAPAKLQSAHGDLAMSSRQRHKSSGGVLQESVVSGLEHLQSSKYDEERFLSGDNLHHEDCVNVTGKGSTWAEICIRRPSGNTSWLLNCNHLKLMSVSAELSSKLDYVPFEPTVVDNDMSPKASQNTENISQSVPRHRSRTLPASQGNVQEAAMRAAAKAKNYHAAVTKPGSSDESAKKQTFCKYQGSQVSLSPKFVFLQLFYSAVQAEGIQRPLALPNSATIERAVSMLDLITPYDTWGTGVVYVQPGQSDDGKAILCNEFGSTRYHNFLASLGKLIFIADCDMSHTYLGGLDNTSGEDGEFTYVWQENIMQMVFHVATLMPNRESGVSNKQRHIGNDYVMIVYDDNNSRQYVPGCVVRGQFLSIEIIISPLDSGFSVVELVYHQPKLKDILEVCNKRTVSDGRLGMLVRQLALHANMAARAFHNKASETIVSKPLSRLKQIKRIRSRAIQEIACKDKSNASRYADSDTHLYPLEEFSDYV